MSVEAAPRPTGTKASTEAPVEVFAPVSPENIVDPQESTPRLLVRAARRVAELSNAFGDNLENRRTASELLDDSLGQLGDAATARLNRGVKRAGDIRDHMSEFKKGAEVYGKQRLKAMGHAARKGLVAVVTSPAWVAEKGVDAARKGLENIEARAQAAAARQGEEADVAVLEASSEQDTAVISAPPVATEQAPAPQANTIDKPTPARAQETRHEARGRAALAKETARQQKKAAAREAKQNAKHEAFMKRQNEQIQRANAAYARKQQRRESRQAWKERNILKPVRRARKLGGAALNGGLDVVAGLAALGAEAGREAREVGGELYDKAALKASEARKDYHIRRGHKAAKRASTHLNKATGQHDSYSVPVYYEDGRD